MEELKDKHPCQAPILQDTLLNGPALPVPNYFFDTLDEQEILKAAKDTKGSGGPSSIDADQFRRILCSKNFLKEGEILREEISDFACKSFCSDTGCARLATDCTDHLNGLWSR